MNKVEEAEIASQVLSMVDAGTCESDLLEVLHRHHAEQTPAGVSVDAGGAIKDVALVLVRLLIGFEPKMQRQLCDLIWKKAREERLKGLARSQGKGTA